MSDPIQNLAEKLRQHDPDRFLAVMSLPVKYRAPLISVYAFNLELARIPYLTAEPMIAEMRLQFWREVIEDGYAGKTRAHEVAEPFARLLQDTSIAQPDCMRLIDARQWDIHEKRFKDDAAFEQYMENTGGALARIAAAALGADDLQRTRASVSAIGGAVARWMISYHDLKAHGISPLLDETGDTIRALAEIGLKHIETVGRIRKPSGGAIRSDWMAKPILKAAIADPQRVLDGNLDASEGIKKFRLLMIR